MYVQLSSRVQRGICICGLQIPRCARNDTVGSLMPKLILFCALALVLFADAPPGSLLTPGMQLVYEEDGEENRPWTVLHARDTVLGGMTQCRVIALQMDGRATAPRLWCARGDTLWAWNGDTKTHAARRPLGEGQRVTLSGPRGTQFRYANRAVQEQTISGVQLKVVQVVMVTDSAGKEIRRLREFYAPALATATSGVFEVPDSTVPGGWRMTTSFKLVRITR
jgi:hypothetical protein